MDTMFKEYSKNNIYDISVMEKNDAGIEICLSRGRTLFHSEGSRIGLEGVGGGGYTYKTLKTESKIIKKAFATMRTWQNDKH